MSRLLIAMSRLRITAGKRHDRDMLPADRVPSGGTGGLLIAQCLPWMFRPEWELAMLRVPLSLS
jgi:hypothetical protein